MTILSKLSAIFRKQKGIEATICDDLDPYMVSVVNTLNNSAQKPIKMTGALPFQR